MKTANQTAQIRMTVRVSKSVRDTLEQAAELVGSTVNQFVVQTAYTEARA